MLKSELLKKNYVNFSVKNDLSIEKVRNSFILKKMKKIFFNWNIIFFKLINLRKNKIKIAKIKLYSNTYVFNYLNLKNLNKFFKLNKELIKKNINILGINYNGYYINYNLIKRWNFSNILFEKVFFNLFNKLILSLVIKILFVILYKLLYYIKFNFSLVKEKNV